MGKHIRARLDKTSAITLSQDGQLPSDVLVLPVGEYDTYIGKFDFTDAVLSEMATNFLKGVPNAVPINFDHSYGEAAGWVSQLTHKMGDGLYATVEWTKTGAEALSEKLYRFLSAEFNLNYEDSTYGNLHGATLTGIGLTNYPMLQNLPALMSQQDMKNPITILFSKEGASMNLDEIRSKDAADVTDEEKQFLQEHVAELNEDERTKFGVEVPANPEQPQEPASPEQPEENPAQPEQPAEEPAAPAEMSQGKGEAITLSRAEFAALQQAANAGAQAKVELDRQRTHKEAEKFVFSATNQDGTFLPKSHDKLTNFMFSLSSKQKAAFSDLMAEMPKGLNKLFSTAGEDGSTISSSDDPSEQLNAMAQAKMTQAIKDGQPVTFAQALKEVAKENMALTNDAYGQGDN